MPAKTAEPFFSVTKAANNFGLDRHSLVYWAVRVCPPLKRTIRTRPNGVGIEYAGNDLAIIRKAIDSSPGDEWSDAAGEVWISTKAAAAEQIGLTYQQLRHWHKHGCPVLDVDHPRSLRGRKLLVHDGTGFKKQWYWCKKQLAEIRGNLAGGRVASKLHGPGVTADEVSVSFQVLYEWSSKGHQALGGKKLARWKEVRLGSDGDIRVVTVWDPAQIQRITDSSNNKHRPPTKTPQKRTDRPSKDPTSTPWRHPETGAIYWPTKLVEQKAGICDQVLYTFRDRPTQFLGNDRFHPILIDLSVPRSRWDGKLYLCPRQEVLQYQKAAAAFHANATVERATKWLVKLLKKHGPMRSADIKRQAREARIADVKLDNAKVAAGVLHRRFGFGADTFTVWFLPGQRPLFEHFVAVPRMKHAPSKDMPQMPDPVDRLERATHRVGMAVGDLGEKLDKIEKNTSGITKIPEQTVKLWEQSAQAPNGKESPAIPPEHRTRPMSMAEAAKLMGYTATKDGQKIRRIKKAVDILRSSIKDGTVAHEALNRKQHIFDRRQFPKEAQGQL
jgi:hypothetical protein